MLLSHFGCADRLYHKNPPNPPISEKKNFPPEFPPFLSFPRRCQYRCQSIGGMPVVFYAGRGLNPRPERSTPAKYPATPNPESHPLPNAGQCRSEVAPPTGIHRPTSNQRNVITPPSPAHSKTTASTDYHPPPPPPTPPAATTSAKPEKPAPDAASSPQPARPPNKTPPRPLPNHSDYPDTPPSPPPRIRQIAKKKFAANFPRFFFQNLI